jgi:serine/threonine protein kinase
MGELSPDARPAVSRVSLPDGLTVGTLNRAGTDFGLGRVNDNPLRTHASTHVAGTAAYMSPEQCDGHVSQKVDIYALGVILNECLSGEMPFHNYSNPMQVRCSFAPPNKMTAPALPSFQKKVP